MAAQDAELKLKVSLDLGFFKQQLAGLGQAAAGYNMPINVKFDRSAITKELRNLERALGKKKINIELNLLGGLTKDQLERIQGRLEALSKTKKVEIPVSVKNGATGRDIQETIVGIRQRIAANQQIRQGDGKLRIPTSIKPSITNADVSEFKKAVQQKLSGISVKVKAEVERGFSAGPTGAAGLFEYMRSQGLSGGNVPQATEVGRSERLKKALEDLTVKQLQALAKEQGIGGVSRLKKDPLIDKLVAELNQDIAENILGNIKNQLRDVGKSPLKGVLDTFARGLFNMLGMDPASMRQQMAQQMAQQRALPGLNFPATVPSRPISIGPSGTGRALPPGAIPGALPGTAFGAQRYLPSALGEEMKRVLREAANAFLDSIRTGIRQVNVRDMGPAVSRQPLLQPSRIAGFLPGRPSQASTLELNNILAGAVRAYLQAVARDIVEAPKTRISRQPLLGPGSQVAGLLPAAGGTTPANQMRFNAVRTGATLGQQQFMRAPSIPVPVGGGGGATPPSGGGRGGAGGFGGFGRAMGSINLPGSGTIRELGEEFGFATKQVLLFGQAYKLLGFLQSFPGQVATAVGQLQSFRNSLGEVTTSTQEFATSNRYILSLVDQYNIPLQSARDGFTKLYASMQPAGFAGNEIRGIFEGISMGAATFGMSADKVDRVMYAFAQMASKGQVMSEELKGQLGDVLPGALSLFAKAANMSVQDFGQAMEDGAFKGEAMKQLLINVGATMKEEFGKGAVGAASTFQGVMNRLQTTVQLFYEAFEPAAVLFSNAFILPITNGIRTVTDGFNQLMTGQAAITQGGAELASSLQSLIPSLQGIWQNLQMAAGAFMNIAGAVASVVKVYMQFLSLPIVGVLAQTYTTVLLLNGAFTLLGGKVLMGLIASLVTTVGRMTALQMATIATNTALAGTQLQLRLLASGLAATSGAAVGFAAAFRTALLTTGVGAVAVFVGYAISEFMRLRGVMDDIMGRYKNIGDQARLMGESGNVSGIQKLTQNLKEQANTYEDIAKGIEEGQKRIGLRVLGKTAVDAMKRAGLGGYLSGSTIKEEDIVSVMNAINKNRQETKSTMTILAGQRSKAEKAAAELDAKLKKDTIKLQPGKDGKDGRAAEKTAEEARKLADDKRKYEADLMKLSSQQAIDLNEMEFDQWKNLQQAKYDFLEAGQNDWMSREIKFQRDLQAIEIRRIEAIRRARIETVKAETEAQSRAYVAGGAGIGATTGLMQGSTGVSSGPHFDVRRADGSRISEAEARALFDPAVRRQLQMTSGYGPRNTGIPGASTFHRGIDLAGPANTPLNLAPGYSMQGAGMEGGLGYTANVRGPQGQMYKVGHLQEPKSGMPASRVRAEAKKDYSAALASQEAINAKEKENAQIKYANIQAQQELNILIREYTASIVPIEQQRLENTLLQNRIDLMTSGLFGEALDTEQKISETREKAALGVQMANDAIAANNKLVKDGILTQEQADRLNASNVEKIKQLTEGLQNYVPLLRERLKLEQSSAEASLMGQIRQESPLGGMGLSAGFIGPAADKYVEAIGRDSTEEEASRFAGLQNQLTLLETRNEAIKQSIYGIGDAFGEAMTTGVAGLISGTATAKEVFASFLQSVGQALSQAASQMIATYIAIGIAKLFAGLGGGGNPAGSGGGISDSLPGIRQYAGGMGGGGAPGSMPFAPPAFANGGIVTGPTLSLIGEGKYNEAVVPLPDGRSIPVQLGGRSARDMMGGNAPGMPQAPSLSMKFETTKINGVEYVSREQLEQAMTETRRASIAGGAQRGMSMTLDKIKQSPSTRSSIGIR
jgi:tape measure domain-containing protein